MALMYYIGCLIKKLQDEHPNVQIPLNLTFTGMGSKYINLISNEKEDIVDLSKLLLRKFTGLNIPTLFKVEFAPNAKEVTAEGGVKALFVGGNRIAVTERNDIYGIDNVSRAYQYQEIREIKEQIISEFEKFISYLDDQEIKQYLHSKYELTISSDFKANLRTYAEQSLKSMINTIPDDLLDLNVTEPLFFWPLKDAIYQMSKEYK